MSEKTRFQRIPNERFFGLGVCAGIAYGLGISPWLVRTFFCFLLLVSPFTAVLYAFAAFLMKPAAETPADYHDRTYDDEDSI